jgi:prepilin-type N-terminal cleavage/methylation domain-containing protein
MKGNERGMTLIEVSVALAILLIGVGFILKSDWVSYHYQNERQLRQQMLFYAAGQVEALVEGKESYTMDRVDIPPFNNFQVNVTRTSLTSEGKKEEPVLEKIIVTVSLKDSPSKPEPVKLMTYRVRAGVEE